MSFEDPIVDFSVVYGFEQCKGTSFYRSIIVYNEDELDELCECEPPVEDPLVEFINSIIVLKDIPFLPNTMIFVL